MTSSPTAQPDASAPLSDSTTLLGQGVLAAQAAAWTAHQPALAQLLGSLDDIEVQVGTVYKEAAAEQHAVEQEQHAIYEQLHAFMQACSSAATAMPAPLSANDDTANDGEP